MRLVERRLESESGKCVRNDECSRCISGSMDCLARVNIGVIG